jgi:hypothetical protein
MTDDEPRTEPTDDQPAGEGVKGVARPRDNKGAPKEPDEAVVEADKTDMSAVGDDGQVFGG